MKIAPLLLLAASLIACDDAATPAASGSATAASTPPTTKPSTPAPSATPTQAPTATASEAAPVLPGTPLKDTLKGVDTIMGLGKATGPMGSMASDKKDIAAILEAIGTDQTLSKGFGPKCITPTRLAFQDKDKKNLGMIGFCDTDETFASARFDGPGADKAEVTIKNPAALKALMKKIGVLK